MVTHPQWMLGHVPTSCSCVYMYMYVPTLLSVYFFIPFLNPNPNYIYTLQTVYKTKVSVHFSHTICGGSPSEENC